MTATLTSDGERQPLPPGSRLGAYEIVRYLAGGGMADVYAAWDARLQRTVAVKVLPAVFGGDRERILRFAQEIRATARLNHPNVVSIYDVGENGSTPWFVTEMLEGETLRSRLNRGPLSVTEALDLAVQICRGLAAAHAQAIVHRDLKPANIFITRHGDVKILDFGLAKMSYPDREAAEDDEDTVSVVSEFGKVIGSVGYMSPEQVQGAPADHRSDIFAFGAILYEMLSGQRAFRRDSKVSTMHAILAEPPPDLHTTANEVPEPLIQVVERCLAKTPAGRFQTVEDLLFALSLPFPRRASFVQRHRCAIRRAAVGLATIAVVILAGAGVVHLIRQRTSATRKTPADVVELTGMETIFAGAMSPDLRFFAYTRQSKGSIRLRHIASSNEVELLAPHRSAYLGAIRFSPDGNYIYYSEAVLGANEADPPSHEIRRISVLGGAPVTVLRTRQPQFGYEFSPDGRSIAVALQDYWPRESVILMMNSDGSGQRRLATLKAPHLAGLNDWSRDGKTLTAVLGSPSPWNLAAIDARTGHVRFFAPRNGSPDGSLQSAGFVEGRTLVATTQSAKLVRVKYPEGTIEPIDIPGQFAFVRVLDSTTLLAARRDLETSLWSMTPFSAEPAERVTATMNSADGRDGLALLPDGRIVFTSTRSASDLVKNSLWVSEADGAGRRLLAGENGRTFAEPVASRDNGTIFFTEYDGPQLLGPPSRIVRMDVNTGARTVLTKAGAASHATVTPDGKTVYFLRGTRLARSGIASVPAAGGAETPVSTTPCHMIDIDSTGTRLLCGMARQIVVLPATGGRPIATFAVTTSDTTASVRWVPGRNAITYVDRERSVVILDVTSGKATRDPAGGARGTKEFAWSPDGRRLITSRSTQLRQFILLRNFRLP